MKYFASLIITFLIAGCAPSDKNPMQGEEVNLKADAYVEMCIRDPNSPLCPSEEIQVTNSSNLNEQWCNICKIDNSYSWCNNFPTCVPEKELIIEKNHTNNPMKGETVRIRAQAYEDLCARTPDSVLCVKE